MTTYTYSLAEAGEDFLIQRKRDDSDEWQVVCMVPDRDVALDMVRDLNVAQRMRPKAVEDLAPGQELVQRPLSVKG